MRYWFLFLVSALFGQIVECHRFADVCHHAQEETLLIFDIDDTLLVPVQMVGCDEWFTHRWNTHLEAGLDRREALERSLAEWEAVRHLTQMEIVEPGSQEILSDLQKRGFTVMGLTTQGLALATRTSLQLKGQGIDLKKTAPRSSDLYFENGAHGVLYRNGILFTSGTHKGEALFKCLDLMGYHPKHIVFLNDKASHLAELEAVAERRGCPFVGLRYGYSDARKKAFRAEVAEYQFHNSPLSRLLSDEEAMNKMGFN